MGKLFFPRSLLPQELDGKEIKQEALDLLSLADNNAENLTKSFIRTSRSLISKWEESLFNCYDVLLLPPTNAVLESRFNCLRSAKRRISGRKKTNELRRSCEAAFSILRRFTIVYKSFPTKKSTERFFSLFVLYYNLKLQHYSDGAYVAPLTRAGITLRGSYLSYLGYADPHQIVSYSNLPASQILSSSLLLDLSTSEKVSTSYRPLCQPV